MLVKYTNIHIFFFNKNLQFKVLINFSYYIYPDISSFANKLFITLTSFANK